MPTEKEHAGSAPELPHEVAKEYGLHKEGVHPTHPKAGSSVSHEDPKDDKTATEDNSSNSSESSSIDDDPKTDAAVDDILTKESDQLLAVQDGNVPHVAPEAKRRHGKLRRFFSAWWKNKWARWITIIILLAAIATVMVIPKARYAVLNTAGVRSSASVVVLDNATQLPLKNVTVTIGGHKALTDKSGTAKFKGLRLGDYRLTIKRIAFASYTQPITVGWGSNPLGSFKIKATGIQYVLSVTDYISGKPIEGAEVVSEETNALSDKSGKIVLTVEDTNALTLNVSLDANGYRGQKLTLNATDTTTKVVLVPSAKDVFVSNQSGKYDVYSVDLDGQNRKLLLAGTGNENPNISLVVSPDGKRAAVVSTRDNLRDDGGYLLQALTIINLEEGTSVTVDHAEQLQLIDWVGDRLIYRMTLAGASAANSQRSRIISYNFGSNARVQLANANQFNAAFSTRGYVYYAASSTDPDAALGLFKVKSDGSARKKLSNDEIWTAVRSAYNTVNIQTPGGWQLFDISRDQLTKSQQPGNIVNIPFSDSIDGSHSAWIDTRDGRETMLIYDTAKNNSKTLIAQEGITSPVRWMSNSLIVYRVVNNTETADYAVSTAGGSPHKITDVSAVYGYAQIY